MQIPHGAFDLAPLIPIAAIAVFGLLKVIRSPIGTALADRIRGGPAQPELEQEVAGLREDLERTQEALAEVQERLDFTERLLAGGHQAPIESDQHTPV